MSKLLHLLSEHIGSRLEYLFDGNNQLLPEQPIIIKEPCIYRTQNSSDCNHEPKSHKDYCIFFGSAQSICLYSNGHYQKRE